MCEIIVGAGSIKSNLIELGVNNNNHVMMLEQVEEQTNAASAEYDCLASIVSLDRLIGVNLVSADDQPPYKVAV